MRSAACGDNSTSTDRRCRFGADFDLAGEQTAGPAGRAGTFVLYHLVRKGPGACLFPGRAVEALAEQVGVAQVARRVSPGR